MGYSKQGQKRGRLGAIDRQAQQTVRKILVCFVVVATWQYIPAFSYSSKPDHRQELNHDLLGVSTLRLGPGEPTDGNRVNSTWLSRALFYFLTSFNGALARNVESLVSAPRKVCSPLQTQKSRSGYDY